MFIYKDTQIHTLTIQLNIFLAGILRPLDFVLVHDADICCYLDNLKSKSQKR